MTATEVSKNPIGHEVFDMSFVNILDKNLRVIAEFRKVKNSQDMLIFILKIFFDSDFIGTLKFNVYGYNAEECKSLATTIKDNEYIMRQIDGYLSGEDETE